MNVVPQLLADENDEDALRHKGEVYLYLYDVIYSHHPHLHNDVLLRTNHVRHLATSRSAVSDHVRHRHAEDSLRHVAKVARSVRTRRLSGRPTPERGTPTLSVAVVSVVAVRGQRAHQAGGDFEAQRGKDDNVGNRRLRRLLDAVLCRQPYPHLLRLPLSPDHRTVRQ